MTDTPAPKPELPLDQILELLSEHIASNDRVTDAVDRFEKTFPKESERILAEHRKQMPEAPVYVPTPLSEGTTPAQRSTHNLVNLWGMVLTVLVIACSCLLLFFVLTK